MKTHKIEAISIGYHNSGYRIDNTVSLQKRYTRWDIDSSGKWVNPRPVGFHSMPKNGWRKVKRFDWNNLE